MTLALLLCGLAFAACFLAARKSLPLGILVVIAIGYAYGIVRANVISWATHFFFDAALFGFYFAAFSDRHGVWRKAPEMLRNWCLVLAAWPCLLALLPFQTPLITLVGLRGNLYFLPVILIGACLTRTSMVQVAQGLAVLNVGAFGVAMAEYYFGLERFFPYSPVTELIYRSRDVEGGHYRLVATFANAHAYAATMTATLPVSLGALAYGQQRGWKRLLVLLGIGAAIAGVLLASTRTNFVVMMVVAGYSLFRGKMGAWARIALLAIAAGAAVTIAINPRMNRFESLSEGSAVAGRISGSVNRSFLEVLVAYPMGNGLGGGGTSIPHFLAHELRRPTAIESEYGRILLEQGIIGLVLWLSFVTFVLSKGFSLAGAEWPSTKRICWLLILFVFGTAAIGTGLLTAIPVTFLWLLLMGWLVGSPMNQPSAHHQMAGKRLAYPRSHERDWRPSHAITT